MLRFQVGRGLFGGGHRFMTSSSISFNKSVLVTGDRICGRFSGALSRAPLLGLQRHPAGIATFSSAAGTAPSLDEAVQELQAVCQDETQELKDMLVESRENDTFLDDFGFSKVAAPEPLVHLQKSVGQFTVDVLFNPSDGQDGEADNEVDEEDEEEEEGFEEDAQELDDAEDGEAGEFDDGPDVKVLIQVSRRGDLNEPALHVDGYATAEGTLQLESFWFELPSLGRAAAGLPESQDDLEQRLANLADDLDEGSDFDGAEPATVNLDSLSPEFETPFYQFMESLGITDDLSFYVNEQTAVWDAERTVDTLQTLHTFIGSGKQ